MTELRPRGIIAITEAHIAGHQNPIFLGPYNDLFSLHLFVHHVSDC